MPISRGSAISAVIAEIKFLNPHSILDIGVGWGLMGVIFRAYTDIRLAELKPSRYKNWETKIDGIEIFKEYENPLWKVYNNVYIGDALKVIDVLDNYDLIYLGDVLEHFEKDKGIELLNKLFKHTNNILIAIPDPAPPQNEILGNPNEKHLSSWWEYQDSPHIVIGYFDGILLVKLKK